MPPIRNGAGILMRWQNSAAIVRKPALAEDRRSAFYDNPATIVAPVRTAGFDIGKPRVETGPCFAEYERVMLERNPARPVKDLRRRLKRTASPDLLKGDGLLGG